MYEMFARHNCVLAFEHGLCEAKPINLYPYEYVYSYVYVYVVERSIALRLFGNGFTGSLRLGVLLLLCAGRVVCTLHSHLDVLFCTCSIITLVAIALDRWYEWAAASLQML